MSSSSVAKSIKNISDYVQDNVCEHNAYLVSDSNGRYLFPHLERRDNLRTLFKFGARIGDSQPLGRLSCRLTGEKSPLVLVWLDRNF